MSGQIYSFVGNPIPPIIFLDSSVILGGIIVPPPTHKAHSVLVTRQNSCLRFLQRLRKKILSQKCEAYISLSVFQETIWIYICSKSRLDRKKFLAEHKTNPSFISNFQNDVAILQSFINANGISILTPEDLSSETSVASLEEEMVRLMFNYSLLPADALHAAYALRAGCDAIASADSDFERIKPEIDVFLYQ
jgi:predicted nucleic acid-binding protein